MNDSDRKLFTEIDNDVKLYNMNLQLKNALNTYFNDEPLVKEIIKESFNDKTLDILISTVNKSIINSKTPLINPIILKAKAPNNFICAICYENEDEKVIKTKCNHYFHTSCLTMWFKHKRSCPNCRTSLHDIFDLKNMFKPDNIAKLLEGMPEITGNFNVNNIPTSYINNTINYIIETMNNN